MTKKDILERFQRFSVDTGGIGSWLVEDTDDRVFHRLGSVNKKPLSKVQLNQLLVLAHEAPVSDGFFTYYWLSVPNHPYDVLDLPPSFPQDTAGTDCREQVKPAIEELRSIMTLDHLEWGLYRFYVDALLWFGNVRTAFRALRSKTYDELVAFFERRRFPTELISSRGAALRASAIDAEDRYLVSEMACKSYGERPEHHSKLREVLLGAFEEHKRSGPGAVSVHRLLKERQDLLRQKIETREQFEEGVKTLTGALAKAYEEHQHVGFGPISIRRLLESDFVETEFGEEQAQLVFSARDILDQVVGTREDLERLYKNLAKKFSRVRSVAFANTDLYLSMVGDLDVYVATSMRTPEDFSKMAVFCDSVFSHDNLADLELRYFDPTLSAAGGHEDKGLIECLMVKCARVLVYCAGERESFGKDAEAAMALSLGKPVIFYCTETQKEMLYREVHPLTRLIEFGTGVAVGAMVVKDTDEVAELLWRLFNNGMKYALDHTREEGANEPGYLRLMEELSGSAIRLQTSDALLTETFWNHYHDRGGGSEGRG